MSEELTSPSEPQEPVAPPPVPVEEPIQAAPVDEDAALDAETIEIPTGEKLVPLSAVTRLRAELKEIKGSAKEVETLRAKLKETESNLQAAAPYIAAAKAMIEAQRNGQQPQPAQPEGPTPEERAELEEIAKDFDFYKADGSLDLAKAERHQKRTRAEAARIAQEQMQPVVTRTLSQDAAMMLARAKNTVLPGTQEKADADILDGLWQRIAQQPGGLQSLANPEAAKHLWNQAYALTKIRQAQHRTATTPQEPPPAALFTEKAGGATRDTIALTESDRRLARDLGMSEAEYQKEVAKMPAGWGGRR